MKVKSLKVKTIPKEAESEPFTSQVIHYDREGREIAHYDYSGAGRLEGKSETKFDQHGQVVEEATYQDESQIAERKLYTRNEKGGIVRVDISFSDGSQSVRTVDRDDINHTENIVEVDEEEEMESREFQQFSPDGKLVVRELYDYHNKLLEAFEYFYDEEGRLITRKQLDNRRKLLIETEFRYNAADQIEFRANRNRKGQLSDFLKIEYNELGQVTRQNLSGQYFFSFQYDGNGNIVVEERYLGEALDHRTSYEYNAQNQLVQEDQPELIKEYHYELYDEEC